MDRNWIRGLLTLATAVLVGLKLAGAVGWSWVIVFSPVWLPAALSVGLRAGLAALAGALAYLVLLDGDLARLPAVLEQIPLLRELPWERMM